MNRVSKRYDLLSKLSEGRIYSWRELEALSSSLGRDLKQLQTEGYLRKVGPGLYLKPKPTNYGPLPATAKELATAFLKTDDFLIVSPTLYNGLGLGLTQLKNKVFIYNKKRHGVFRLSKRKYDFRLKTKGYPAVLTKEYLLLDLVNNIDEVGESPSWLLNNVAQAVNGNKFDNDLLFALAKQYGHVYTKKFFSALERGEPYPVRKDL